MTKKSSVMRAAIFMMLCSSVADPTRLRALFRLGEGPLTIGELALAVGVTQGAISRHVKRMQAAGLVAAERRGRFTIVRRRERRWAVVASVIAAPWEEM